MNSNISACAFMHRDSWKNHDPDGDDDFDGILNRFDCCPSTPALVWVNAKGCPLTMDIDEVVIRQIPQTTFIFTSFDWNQLDPPAEIPMPAWGVPVDILGGGVGGEDFTPFIPLPTPPGDQSTGKLCGFYAFAQTGNAVTGQIHGAGQKFVNDGTLQPMGARFNLEIPIMCVTIPYTSPIMASNNFKNAFNFAISSTVFGLSTGTILPTDLGVKTAFLAAFNTRLNILSSGSTISYGPCLGGIPQTQAHYIYPNGQCQ